MASLDELSLNEVMLLFEEKKNAEKQADLTKLIALKRNYPQLFSKEFENMAYGLIGDVTSLMESRHFKALRREEEKRKFFVVDHDSWKTGKLDEALAKLEVVYYKYIRDIARELVKESVASSLQICQVNDVTAKIDNVFPFLGILISQLLSHFPEEKREKMQARALFKLNQGEEQATVEEELQPSWCLPLMVFESLQYNLQMLVAKTIKKFDKREGFYSDCLFFCLLEVCEFIGLMSGHVSKSQGQPKKQLIKHIASFIA